MGLSNPSYPILSGLLRKRQEIAAEIEEHQAKLDGLVLDVDAVDATIWLFSPELDVQTVRVRPTPRRHGVQPGHPSRLILSLIRDCRSATAR